MGAAIVAMGLLALFAWSTVPQTPPESPRAAGSTLASGATAPSVNADSSSR